MCAAIDGLLLETNWLSPEDELELIAHAGAAGRFNGHADRNRVHRYGPGVPHSGYTEADHYDPEIPPLLQKWGALLPVFFIPDAITVGWYLPSQRMRPHIDSLKSGPVIAVLSLLGDATIQFTKPGKAELVGLRFPRRSLLVMQGPARWEWMHEILPVSEPRISIVFRRAARHVA